MEGRLKTNDQLLIHEIFRIIYDKAPVGAELYDSKGLLVVANQAAADIFGFKNSEDITGFKPFEGSHITAAQKKRLRSGEPVQCELSFDFETAKKQGLFRTTKSGLIHLDVVITPLTIQGEVAGGGYLVQIQDITDRVQEAAALRESEARFRALFEQAAVGMAEIDTLTGRFIHVNQRYADMLGTSIKELQEKTIQTITYPEDLQADLDNMSLLTDGKIRQFSMGKRYIRKDGEIIWVSLSVSPLWAPGEAPSHHVVIITDVTGRKRTEDELCRAYTDMEARIQGCTAQLSAANAALTAEIKERRKAEKALWNSEKNLHHITSSVGAGIYVIDVRGAITFMNPMAKRLLGWSMDELNEKWAHNLIHRHRADGRPIPFKKCRIQNVLRSGKAYASSDEIFSRKDGSSFPVSVVSAPMMEDGKAFASVTVFQDITERKQAEEKISQLNTKLRKKVEKLEAAYRDMESFSYSAAHDLRQPLVVIGWYAKKLRKRYAESLDEEGREKLTGILDSVQTMEQLLTDLMAFSRVSARKINPAEIDMEALVQTTFKELEATLERRHVALKVKSPPDAFGDPSLLHIVLMNLLANALKYTRDEKVARIEVGGAMKGDETLYYVKDNGIGFDMAHADKLFGLFQRLHAADAFEGTGVGLVISKRIVEKHGGKMWAEGKPGKGAIFFFSLPCKESASNYH
jgi:PAS domain S-box-containing protein